RLHAVIVEKDPGATAAAVRAANQELDDRQQVREFRVLPEEDLPRTHTLAVRRRLGQEWLAGQESVARQAQPPAVSDTDPLSRLIAQCTSHAGAIDDGQELGTDLGLDSLGRVELLSAIEEELGVYVDDTEVGSRTT